MQAAAFAGANLLVAGLAVVSTAMLTRHLRTSDFGSYAFATSLFAFVALFFEFGLFLPAAREAAVASYRLRQEIVGAALVAYLPVGLAFSATIFGLSFWIDRWFHVDAGYALRIAAPAALVFPFLYVLQQLAQGVDRLHVASLAAVAAQLLFVALLALRLGLGATLTTPTALVLRSLAFLAASAGAALWLRPSFRAVAHWLRVFVRHSREWGFQQYLGRLLSIGTYNMDVLMLGIWTGSRPVGLYVLAGSLSYVSGLPVLGLATALFARMARDSRIARRWLVIAVAVGMACALGAWLLAEPIIRTFFSARYVGAASLVLPLALAQFVRGVTGIFNTFLSAHGRGVDLRNAGLVLTISNLAFNFALIPPFGARGAAWASLFALAANLVAHLVFYRRRQRVAVAGGGPSA